MSALEKQIGKHIKEVRMERGLSQETLAEMCGFSNTTLSSYENGRKNPSLDTIATIAKRLKVSIERLYYGDENNSFIISEPDEGKKIVNSVYFLWKSGVIYYYENYMAGVYPAEFLQGDVDPRGIYLQLVKYCTPVKRLINSLNEYQRNEKTYPDPEKYLDILLSSVATEINNEIAAAKAEEERKQAKQKAMQEKQRAINEQKKNHK